MAGQLAANLQATRSERLPARADDLAVRKTQSSGQSSCSSTRSVRKLSSLGRDLDEFYRERAEKMFYEDGQAAGYLLTHRSERGDAELRHEPDLADLLVGGALEVKTVAPESVPLAAGADLDPDRPLASVERLEGDRADPLSAHVGNAERVVEER
jgi:hypothetical protein